MRGRGVVERGPADVLADCSALLAGGNATGTRGSVLVVVSGTDLHEASCDLVSAVGLGLALVRRGWGVRVGRGDRSRRWVADPATDLVLALDPAFDVEGAPDSVVCMAWCGPATSPWCDAPGLPLYDVVLAGSEVAADALRDAGARHVRVLRPAVDGQLFQPSHRRGTEVLDGGRASGPVDLGQWAAEVAAAARVVAGVDVRALRHGVVDAAVLEALASGVPVESPSRLGLVDSGLVGATAAGARQAVDDGGHPWSAEPAEVDRLRDQVLAEHSWDVRAAELEALLADARSADRPLTIGFLPDFRVANPYQDMLYADLREAGVRIAPVSRPMSRTVVRDDGGRLDHYVLHLHWTAPVLQSAPGPLEALRRLDAFRAQVEQLKARGGALVWTVHNVLPHECRHLTVEVELARFLARTADVVHVLDASTLDLVRDWYEIPATTAVVVPHSSYTGVYPDVVDRAEARRRLEVAEDEVALLMLGRIRPYKGVDLMLEALELVRERLPRVRLLLAGKPEHIPDVDAWCSAVTRNEAVTASFGHVPDSELQVWARAADLAVLPYVDVLNSGVHQLALTFGLPAVVPSAGTLRHLADPTVTRTFTPGSAEELADAVVRAVTELLPAGAADRARELAEAAPYAVMADGFAAALAERLPAWAAIGGGRG